MANIKPLTGNHGDFSGIVLKAAAAGHVQAVLHYLERHPAWLDREGPHGRTLVWEAAYRGRIRVLRELIRKRARLQVIGSYYTPLLVELTPLAVARFRGHDDVVDLLRRNGAKDDFWAACHRGDMPKVTRALLRNPRIVQKPIRKKPFHPRMGWLPVHYAVAGKQAAVLELLLQRGALLGDHAELLHDWADDHPPLVKLLRRQFRREGVSPRDVSRPKTIDDADRLGFPPLVDACRGNHNAPDHPERVRELLDRGASIHVRDAKGKTPLHRAAQAGFVKISQLLLERGAKCEATDDQGNTPLFDAAHHGREAMLQLLIDHGANLEHENRKQETPLFAACRKQQVECVIALLRAGADKDHCNQAGQRVAQVVQRGRKTERRNRMMKWLS